jgi:hypothetical protein
MALYKPSLECETLFGDLQSLIKNSLAMTVSVNFTEADTDSQYFLDRRYSNTSSGRVRGNHNSRSRSGGFIRGQSEFQQRSRDDWQTSTSDKKCYICGKTGCWSTNHTLEERKRSKAQYIAHCEITGEQMEYNVFCQHGTPVHKVHVNCTSHVTLRHLLTHTGCVYNLSL